MVVRSSSPVGTRQMFTDLSFLLNVKNQTPGYSERYCAILLGGYTDLNIPESNLAIINKSYKNVAIRTWEFPVLEKLP